MRSVPSGTRIILWMTAAVPTSYRSSQPGCSASWFLTVTSATRRSPSTASSISLIERSWPIASGVIDCGKTTVSLSGRTGSSSGSSSSSIRSSVRSSLMGQPLAHELGRGTRGNREVPPHLWRRGLVGETGFPPRERAEGERRSRTPSDLDRDLLVCGLELGDRHRHGQEAALVLGARVRRIDLLGELNPPLERSMLDLHVEEAAAPGGRARAGDDERLVVGEDPQGLRVDAGELDHHSVLGRVIGANDVHLRPESAAQAGEAGDLPELVDQLLDLALQAVELVFLPCHES